MTLEMNDPHFKPQPWPCEDELHFQRKLALLPSLCTASWRWRGTVANAPCPAAAFMSRSHIHELAAGKELRLLSQQRSSEHALVPGSEDAEVKGRSFLPRKLPCHEQTPM